MTTTEHGTRADNQVASPETALTDTSGLPETRKYDSTTPERRNTRRRQKRIVGFAAILLAGGGIISTLLPFGVSAEQNPAALPSPNVVTSTQVEQQRPRGDYDIVAPVFKEELTHEQIAKKGLPTLNPPSFAEAYANVGNAVQFYVNADDEEGIRRVVPGTTDGFGMQPGQLEYRAAFIKQYRTLYHTEMDKQHHEQDPENNSANYAWGFQVEMLNQLSEVGGNVADAKNVLAHVRITMGDYRPTFDGTNRMRWSLEEPVTFEADMSLTRYTNVATASTQPDNGWMIYDIQNATGPLKVPGLMASTPPEGFTGVPKLHYTDIK